jgi:hypothetical protein
VFGCPDIERKMASTEDGDDAVELIVRDASASEDDAAAAVVVSDEIIPLLNQGEKPKINIFTVSYPRGKPRVKEIKTLIHCLQKFNFENLLWNSFTFDGTSFEFDCWV